MCSEKNYENVKERTKQKFADNSCKITGTGGGPLFQIVITNIAEEVEILGVRLQ